MPANPHASGLDKSAANYAPLSPLSFIDLKDSAQATEAEFIDFCRERMARFKAPKKVVNDQLQVGLYVDVGLKAGLRGEGARRYK